MKAKMKVEWLEFSKEVVVLSVAKKELWKETKKGIGLVDQPLVSLQSIFGREGVG